MEDSQEIIAAITNIRVPGTLTVGYWSILKTSDSIYFVKTGISLGLGATNALISATHDAIVAGKGKKILEKDLKTILTESEKNIRFRREHFPLIETKEGIFGGGTIKFPNGKQKSISETGYVKMKLKKKQFREFFEKFYI